MTTSRGSRVPEPWERQEREGSRSFALFTIYRDLGPSRSLEAVAIATIPGRERGDGRALSGALGRLCKRWEWTTRAEAWDDHQDEIAREAADEHAREVGKARAVRLEALQEKSFAVAEELLERVKAMLQFPVARKEVTQDGKLTVINPARWSWRDLATILQRLNEVAITITGKSLTPDTPTQPGQTTGLDEQRAIIERIMRDPRLAEAADMLAGVIKTEPPKPQ